MPGIHVRSIGRLHWEDHDKEPTLTVPGSYWLCHKNNIYKFTFKFHKTIRNAIDFSHSKELMKIIRRVIKWQPRQGQHFSTKNLLVTYNHASWTRQDKMFAVMKFCDRPDAIAFPHAFILTVKILNQDQQLVENNMGSKETKPQSPVSEDGAIPPESSPSDKALKDKEKVLGMVSTNNQEEKENKSDTSWSLRTRSRQKDVDSNLSTSVTERHDSSEEERQNSINGNGAIESDSTEEVLGKEMESESEETPSQRSTEPASVPIDPDENSNSNDSHSDSASLPYQYLIERDIERELENSRLAGAVSTKENDSGSANVATKMPASPGEQVVDGESQGSRDSRKSAGKQRTRNDAKESGSTPPPPDVTNLRSSDITDLVMKGLMFTIRQDKDTVTVVEQKTKLELDEVLENSEKVETKEGDPCLLNSSLLRLEKMITRMQEPPPALTEQRHNGLAENAFASFVDLADEINIETEKMKVTEQTDKKSVCHSTGPVESANSWSQFFTDKAISDATFQNIEKVLGDSSVYLSDQDEDLELKVDDEEEEDIIPEALVNNSFFDGSLDAMRKTPMLDTFEDLLMDDIEPDSEKIIVVDDEETKKDNFSQSNSDSKINGVTSVKDSSRLPKVISNQIITNDQIPPALLRALKSKSTLNQISHNNEVSTSNNINNLSENNSVNNLSENNNVNNLSENNNVNNLSENNNKINIKNIDSEIDVKLNSNGSVQENIERNVDKFNTEIILKNSAVVVLERHKENIFHQSRENSPVFNSVSSSKVTRKSLLVTENSSSEKSQTSNEVKNSDNNSLSNSNSASSIRLTRSNSKLHVKRNETSASISDESVSRQSRRETRSQKMLEKSSNQLLTNKDLNKKITKSQKRKRSEIDHNQIASKLQQLDNSGGKQEVTVKMWKLINDLTHGVKVVVERVDVTKISR